MNQTRLSKFMGTPLIFRSTYAPGVNSKLKQPLTITVITNKLKPNFGSQMMSFQHKLL
jgi:hypothetical protein